MRLKGHPQQSSFFPPSRTSILNRFNITSNGNLSPAEFIIKIPNRSYQRNPQRSSSLKSSAEHLLPTEFSLSPSGVLLKQQSRDPRWKHFKQSLRQNYTSTTFITYAYKIHMTQISFYFENIITQCIHHNNAYIMTLHTTNSLPFREKITLTSYV